MATSRSALGVLSVPTTTICIPLVLTGRCANGRRQQEIACVSETSTQTQFYAQILQRMEDPLHISHGYGVKVWDTELMACTHTLKGHELGAG